MPYMVETWWDDGEGSYGEDFEMCNTISEAKDYYESLKLSDLWAVRLAQYDTDNPIRKSSVVCKSLYACDDFGDRLRVKNGIVFWPEPDLLMDKCTWEDITNAMHL